MTVTRYRKMAEADQLLKKVKDHSFAVGRTDNRATEFRFDVSRIPLLRDAAQAGTAAGFASASPPAA